MFPATGNVVDIRSDPRYATPRAERERIMMRDALAALMSDLEFAGEPLSGLCLGVLRPARGWRG